MKILLGVTGSVASTLTQKLKVSLALEGHSIKTVVTNSALKFKRSDDAWGSYYTDDSEWEIYRNEQRVLHIDLVKWADIFLIAPCTANTLTKMSLGICDNLLTNCVRAWPKNKIIIVVPAMNTEMFKHPLTTEALSCLDVIFKNLGWIEPTEKKLYCGDTGVGAMANIEDIVTYLDYVNRYLPEKV